MQRRNTHLICWSHTLHWDNRTFQCSVLECWESRNVPGLCCSYCSEKSNQFSGQCITAMDRDVIQMDYNWFTTKSELSPAGGGPVVCLMWLQAGALEQSQDLLFTVRLPGAAWLVCVERERYLTLTPAYVSDTFLAIDYYFHSFCNPFHYIWYFIY